MTKKIVIVDDSEGGLALERMLRRDKNYETVLFTRGRDAIFNLGEFSYFDLAVVDVGLPDMSGEEVIEYLRANYPDKPVFCIASYRGHQSPSAVRTIHKGSASRVKQLVEILEETCNTHSVPENNKVYAYSNPLLRNDP